ncbi:MAG: type II/IV secretion system ATPase subunit [Candidatus Micrarchaeia archaeon]
MAVSEEVLSTYNINANGLNVLVEIIKGKDFVPIYKVTTTGISDATKLLVFSWRQELISMVPIDPTRVQDKIYSEEINRKYVAATLMLINKYLPNTAEETKKVIIAYVLNMMLGFGDLEIPIADPNLEEIAVNGSKQPVWVFHKDIGWCKTTINLYNEDLIYSDAEHIGRNVGREINNLQPLMDAELPDGSRVNATLFPISQVGNTLTIRKFSKNPWTMIAMVKNKSVNSELASLIWLAIQNEICLLISGGTASGKTSFLNAMSIFFPPTRRIISVEETKELSLPNIYQWVSMITRQPNPEGKGEVTLYDLMINALRQRPDIILVGEVRTQKDAETLFEAIHTGHSVYGTVHADNAQDTIVRMTNPPINIPKITMNALGGIIVNFRHRFLGIRRVLEFAEVLNNGDANVLYRWNMSRDQQLKIGTMTRLLDLLNMYAGMSQSDINNDLNEKSQVIEWMVKNNIIDVNNCGLVIAKYYSNKDELMEMVKKDTPFSPELFK